MSICSPSHSLVPREARGKILLNCILCLFLLNTTACNFDFFSSKENSDTFSNPRTSQTALSINEARDIALPAESEDGLGSTPEISINKTDMGEPMGLKPKLLFEEKISNEDDRFLRLENAVQKISEKLDTMAPSVDDLVKIDQDLDSLTEQLEILLQQDTIQPRVRTAALTPTTPMTALPNDGGTSNTTAAPINSDATAAIIQNIRLADHLGKTRIVLETSNHLTYQALLDNNAQTFIIRYSGAVPQIDLATMVKKSKLFKSIAHTQEGNDTLLTFQLHGQTNIEKEGRIKPNKDNSFHRVYIDLKK